MAEIITLNSEAKNKLVLINYIKTRMNTLGEVDDPKLELPCMSDITQEKIDSIDNYCREHGVDFYSELPINKLIIDKIFNIAETAVLSKNRIFDRDEIINKKIVIPFFTQLKETREILKRTKTYFKLIDVMDNTEMSELYTNCYIEYYKAIIESHSIPELKRMLNSDKELAIKLDMKEEYEEFRKIIETIMEYEKSHCKINVYNPN